MKENKTREESYPVVPTDRILRNFKQLSHHNDSISQMASWLSFYRSSGEQLCSLFGEAFVDKSLREEERLAIFYVFHEMVTRTITIDDESRKFFLIGYEQFLLTAAPIISRLTFEQRSPYLQVVRLWQAHQRFPQNVCERLRLLFNSQSGNQESLRNPSILDKRDKKFTLDIIKSLNRIKEGYELAVKAGSNREIATNDGGNTNNAETKTVTDDANSDTIIIDTSFSTEPRSLAPEETEKIMRQSIEQYKESLDKITDASILLSQCLQDELKSFNDIKRILEEISTEDRED
ncbi:uncharacterized protein cubi_03441 [Cryptosporidium ubiquitum]|uniref:CID domain-containing protein n=1 Tax=Cryptosporidium ubiquitum TaxID=857276 RepID=A0A1J4MJL0_9CRYT|nr:uncharacterized protein cubi_03441 [Cryptosporidium ubiquitum]OII73643.1 hypothetical protein cubi_03441 [Cryptosporidium ubiquitum]